MRIRRLNYGQGSGKEEQKLDNSSQPSTEPDQLSLDRMIYKRIGSLTDNKLLVTPSLASTDFNRWLLDMNDLHNSIYYPTIYSGPTPTPDIVALDEYLGMLGDSEVYPYRDDTYSVEPWVSADSQNEYRVLTDDTDNTYLTDDNGDSILVSYS